MGVLEKIILLKKDLICDFNKWLNRDWSAPKISLK